jgi:hypothetical protein
MVYRSRQVKQKNRGLSSHPLLYTAQKDWKTSLPAFKEVKSKRILNSYNANHATHAYSIPKTIAIIPKAPR